MFSNRRCRSPPICSQHLSFCCNNFFVAHAVSTVHTTVAHNNLHKSRSSDVRVKYPRISLRLTKHHSKLPWQFCSKAILIDGHMTHLGVKKIRVLSNGNTCIANARLILLAVFRAAPKISAPFFFTSHITDYLLLFNSPNHLLAYLRTHFHF